MEASQSVQPPCQVHIFHHRPWLKTSHLPIRCCANKQGLIAIGQSQQPGTQVCHEGDKIQYGRGRTNTQAKGAKSDAWVAQRATDMMPIRRRQEGVGMKKHQHIALGMTGTPVHLCPPSSRGSEHLVRVSPGCPCCRICAPPVYDNDFRIAGWLDQTAQGLGQDFGFI